MTILKASEFGAIGDGQTDNAASLIGLRDAMLLEPERRWVVEFDPGEYLYSNNRWLRGVRYVNVYGNGAQFRCTSIGPFERDYRPILSAVWNEDYGDMLFTQALAQPNSPFTPGYKIWATQKGVREVRIEDSQKAQFFRVGSWACVNGYSQQIGGSPQNMRYFQYVKVTDVDVGGGIVRFDQALKYKFDVRWKDVDANTGYIAGKPRIAPLEGQYSCMNYELELNDMEFLDNPNFPGQGLFTLSGLNVKMSGIKTNVDSSVVVGRHFEINNSFFQKFEPDKLIQYLYCENVIFNGFVRSGTGINSIEFHGCEFSEGCQVGPLDQLLLENCSLFPVDSNGHVKDYFSISTIKRVDLVRSIFHGDAPVYSSGAPYTLNVPETGFERILLSDAPQSVDDIRKIQLGTVFYYDPALLSPLGKVVDIYFDNDKHIIQVDFDPAITEILFYDAWHSVTES